MTTLHPFSTSRESVLPIWSSSAQSRRSQPDARVPELFVLLHGMLFTNIQLDDFLPTLARFLERIEIEGAEEREWIMMAVVNVGAILEYGRPSGVLRKIGVVGAREGGAGGTTIRVVAKKHVMPPHLEDDGDEKRMDVDDETFKGDPQVSPALSDANIPVELPVSLKLAMELAFSMLSFVLRNPARKASPFARSTLNPYLSVMPTFLATITKHAEALSVLERSIPWHDLAQFFATIPHNIFSSQVSNIPAGGSERWAMLTSGCAPPLPEDWCLRGMEWVGRKVFERGYWKTGEERRVEMEVLDVEEDGQLTDGIIEDEEDEDEGHSRGDSSHRETSKRWTRILRSAFCLSSVVDGFTWVEGTREWRVEGTLEAKVGRWHEEDRLEREADERRRHGRRWTDDSMDVDGEDEDADELSEESEEDEEDSEEVKALKVGCLVCVCVSGRHLIPFIGPSEIPAISSCIRSACTCSGIQTALAPIPFPETCVDAISEHRAWIHNSRIGYQYHPIFFICGRVHHRKPSMDRCHTGACHNGT
jgi:protein SMG6